MSRGERDSARRMMIGARITTLLSRRFWTCIAPSLCWLCFLLVNPAHASAASSTFEKDIRPILKAHCFDCHGEGEKLNGGLDLRLRRLMLKGGDEGAVIVPGK